MKLLPRPISVTPLENFVLKVKFNNKEIREFDFTPYLTDKFYSPLKNKTLFQTVHTNGRTIEWANGIDMCPDELYVNSR